MAAFAPAAVVDLTGALGAAAVPVLTPRLEGRPALALDEAVRARLGVAHGTVRFRVIEGDAGGRALFQGACCLDHRSLVRSVAWVARKLPAMVQASLARREVDPAAPPPAAAAIRPPVRPPSRRSPSSAGWPPRWPAASSGGISGASSSTATAARPPGRAPGRCSSRTPAPSGPTPSWRPVPTA